MFDLFDVMKEKGIKVPASVEVNSNDNSKTGTSAKNTDNKKEKTKKVEPEKYTLPLTVYYAGSEHYISKEEYPDNEYLLKNNLLTHFQTNFGYRVLTEKRVSLEYDKEANEIIVHLKNPSKGSSFLGLHRQHFNDGTIRFVRSDLYGKIVGPVDGFHDLKSNLEPFPCAHLKHKIPGELLNTIIESFCLAFPNEELAQIYFDRDSMNYILHFPDQTTTCKHISRETGSFFLESKNVVLFSEIHSHGRYSAIFSEEDDDNELDFLVYGVIGQLDSKSPNYRFRIGFNGLFHEIPIEDLFDLEEEVLS